MATQEQIQSFHDFASRQIKNGDAALSMDELYSLWRSKNPTSNELLESVAAVNAAIDDMDAGDTGAPARDALRQTCANLGLVIDE